MFEKLDETSLDTLREICNIGAGHAATALSQLTGRRVGLDVSQVQLAALAEVPALAGGAERPVVGLHFRILGDTRGTLFMVLPDESALALLGILGISVPAGADPFTNEMATSSLKEVGNILASAYLTAINRLTGLALIPSVPLYAHDMAGSIVDTVLIEVGRRSDVALVVETRFLEADRQIIGHVFLIPDHRSLTAILGAVS